MPTYKSPGVYIEEVPAVGPISGVGTSTAGFVGPAKDGPILVPTKITNWSDFKRNFGEYLTSPRFFLANAVEAFFQNGGTVAYVVRVGTAVRAWLELDDRGAGKALRVEALEEGTAGNLLTVEVQDANIVSTATALKASGAITSGQNNILTMADAATAGLFRPGDIVIVVGDATRFLIDRIRGDEIFLDANLAAPIGAETLRIADLAIGQRTFRVANGDGLERGSVVTLDAGGPTQNMVVDDFRADRITFASPLTAGFGMAAADADVDIESQEFNLVVTKPAATPETFENLSMDPRHSRYFGRIVASAHVSVAQADPPSAEAPPNNRPAVVAATNLANGAADDLSALTSGHYITGIESFTRVDDVNILAVPDRTDPTVQTALIAHCESMADRFAVLDSPRNAPPFGAGSVTEHRANVGSQRGYAALYYPWLQVRDPHSTNGLTLSVPPSGHVAGVYARSDNQRGVHKAPANEMVTGGLGLDYQLTDAELGELNVAGIDCIRTFPGRARPTIWGARTTAPAAEAPWRYVNVRRLLLYIEESIEEGIRWAVFEPNNHALWQKLIRTISEFLERVWRDGALFGETADQAFYVKCDEELNPEPVRALGEVYIEIGVAPVRPAEFVIVRIGQWAGGSEVSES